MKIPMAADTTSQDPDSDEVPDYSCEDLRAKILSERSLIIAANRAPVTFELTEAGEMSPHRGEGGLVTALLGLCQYTDATWIACAQSEADTIWTEGDVPLQNGQGSIQVHFVSPQKAAYDGYYNEIANPLLWFLQHSMWDIPRAPVISRATWEAWEQGYVVVNRLFADAIAKKVLNSPQPSLVMLQDYHLYLAARFLRSKLRAKDRPIVSHFIHIPWPGPEYWRILPPPMRYAILDGLCAVDVLGCQTRDDGMNFLRTCETYLPRSHVNYRRGRIWYRNHATHVHDFPISINVKDLRRTAESEEVHEHREDLRASLGDRRLIVRVDRVEPSKNIIRGFQAFEEMLELYPEYCDKVVFLALLAPSRMGVGEYQGYLDEIMAAGGRINAMHGSSEWEPVRVLIGENYSRAMAALQIYDVLLVNSIVDGMNLVAKEGPIVNQRNGVLILSEGTGARQQLAPGALVISPCDVYATARALHQALIMSPEERQERAERLRWIVERDHIGVWLCQQLAAIANLFPGKRV